MSGGAGRVGHCPICDSTSAMVLHDGLRDRTFGVAEGEWRLLRCCACGAARLDPCPDEPAQASFYARYYTHAAPTPISRPVGLRAFIQAARNDHVNSRYGYALSPAARIGRVVGRLVPSLAAIGERTVRSLPAGDRLLDVGCGNGEFLAIAAAAGWQASGIDRDPSAVEAARAAGLDVTLEDAGQRARREPGVYDAVTLSHVVEHVADPIALLRSVHALLRPNGNLWVATPNLRAAGRRRWGRDWMPLEPPRHIVLFDAPSLATALARAGFSGVEVLRPVPVAALSYRISAALRAGVVPAYEAPAPWTASLAAEVVRAECRAQRDWTSAEEVVVRAVRR